MKRFYRLVGLAIGLVAIALSILYVASSWRDQDLSVYASPRAAAGLALGIAFYMTGIVGSAAGWQRLLSNIGIRRTWRELAGVVAITQIGKYLPGNVAQHIGRASMALQKGVPPGAFVVTVGIEMLLLMLASIVVGTIALLLSRVSLSILGVDKAGAIVSIVACLIAAILGLLALRKFGPSLLVRLFPKHAHAFDAGSLPSATSMQMAFACYCLVFLAFGAGIALMARLLTGDAAHDAWLLIASFALAWTIGFVTPGAPAGLGVREGVMLLMLGAGYSAADASVIVVALRMVTTLGDLALLPIGWLLVRKS